ncbi:MAG TPA: hypothetical protein GXZ77_07130 [Papillibacter sp.]|jgi:hypothetical protein|nr:hypothetical protein [Papillibacter sp.]
MDKDFEKMAQELMNSPAASKLSGKKSELEKLMHTPEGKTIQGMLSGQEQNIMQAVSRGDMDVLKSTVSKILQTQEGAKLAEQIMKMMKK